MSDDKSLELQDPTTVYGTPEAVLRDTELTREQKIEVLRRWEYDAAEEAVALEEGMPGKDSDLLRRIILALNELAGPLDLEQVAPSKQHGIPRKAIATKGQGSG